MVVVSGIGSTAGSRTGCLCIKSPPSNIATPHPLKLTIPIVVGKVSIGEFGTFISGGGDYISFRR